MQIERAENLARQIGGLEKRRNGGVKLGVDLALADLSYTALGFLGNEFGFCAVAGFTIVGSLALIGRLDNVINRSLSPLRSRLREIEGQSY